MSKIAKRIASFIGKYFSGNSQKRPENEPVKENDSPEKEHVFLLTKSEIKHLLQLIVDEDSTREEKKAKIRSLLVDGYYRDAWGVRPLYGGSSDVEKKESKP